jgi:hypothetical protein
MADKDGYSEGFTATGKHTGIRSYTYKRFEGRCNPCNWTSEQVLSRKAANQALIHHRNERAHRIAIGVIVP